MLLSLLRGAFAVALALGAGAAAASSLVVSSAAGDTIGQGVARNWTSPTATFAASGDRSMVTIEVEKPGEGLVTLKFAAKQRGSLEEGTYYSAETADRRTGTAPGLDVSINGRTCDDVWGSFTIRQIEDDGTDITAFEATFIQRCGSNAAPVLSGTVAFNVAPHFFTYNSAAGDPVGRGVVRTHYPSTSNIGVNGMQGSPWLTLGVSGLRDNIIADLNPRTGTQFAPGVFPLARTASASAMGIHLQSDHVDCEQASGTINIRSLVFNPEGGQPRIYAIVTVYCNGSSAPFKFTVRNKI